MLEKILKKSLRVFSSVAYVGLMSILFAFPISFFIHAFIPPEFEIRSTKIIELDSGDKYLAALNGKADEWQRIDYSISASSGSLSPYDYVLEELTLKDESIIPDGAEFRVFLDETAVFNKDVSDDMLVSLYIKTDEELDASSFMETKFKCKVYEKNFEEFDCKYGNGKLWK